MVDLLSKYCNKVTVSIDGSNDAVHDRIRGFPGSFQRAYKGILQLQQKGVKELRVSCAINPDNYLDLGNVYNLFTVKHNIPIIFNHYNYIHTDSCEGYDCKPSNMMVYNPKDINIDDLYSMIQKCKQAMFMPNLTTVTELTKYYNEAPTKKLQKHYCRVMNDLTKGMRFVMKSDGSFMISARCWMQRPFENLPQEDHWLRVLNRVIKKEGLPAPCQRLCCGGKTV